MAYAFYATDNTYAIAAMVCASMLRRAGARAEFVLVHLPLSRFVMSRLREMNFRTHLVTSLVRTRTGTTAIASSNSRFFA